MSLRERAGLFKGRNKRLEVVSLLDADTDNPAVEGEAAAELDAVTAGDAGEPGASKPVTPAAAPAPTPPVIHPEAETPPAAAKPLPPKPRVKPQPAPAPPVAEPTPEPERRKARRM
jgi:outer membrane biosynthesis protein TonB